jgi:hypothetical protein
MYGTHGELCVTPRTQCNYVVGKHTPGYVPWLYTEHNGMYVLKMVVSNELFYIACLCFLVNFNNSNI